MVQVWYPTDGDADGEPATYLDRIDVAGPLIASDLNMPRFMFEHLNLSQTASRLGLPIVNGTEQFPIILFSHGIRVGFRGQNTTQLQELASHGYVVASIDHTFGNLYTVFPDGRVDIFANEAIFGDEYGNLEDANTVLDVWAGDMGLVLDEMAQWQQGNGAGGGLFNGRLDLNSIGIFGHSTGGGTTVNFCHKDGRCRAGIGLDSWVLPLSDSVQTVEQPFMFMSTEAWLNPENMARGVGLFNNLADNGYMLNIAGTEHFDFSDMPLFSPLTPQLGLSGTIDSTYSLTLMNEYILSFFNQQLKGEPTPLLDQNDSPYPEVRFEKR
ncbi:MAG: hypothetical protein AAF614_17550 [Chloroflexota bacterium]